MSELTWIPGDSLPPHLATTPETAWAGRKYVGAVASGYDAKRQGQFKWQRENEIVAGMLADLPAGSAILDVPVGTGRFLDLYAARGFAVSGIDLSPDMLAEAKRKAAGLANVSLAVGDILDLKEPDQSCDVALAIRLFNWLSPEDVQTALQQLQRVARQRVIFNVRVRNHPRVRGYDLIQAALADNWRIARDEEIVPDYRMIMLACG